MQSGAYMYRKITDSSFTYLEIITVDSQSSLTSTVKAMCFFSFFPLPSFFLLMTVFFFTKKADEVKNTGFASKCHALRPPH